jgi:hypothetical protein
VSTAKQATRAAARGFPTRTAERRHRMRRRLQTAASAEEQLSAAFDWFRYSAQHMEPAGARAGEMRAMAEAMATAAARIEGDSP